MILSLLNRLFYNIFYFIMYLVVYISDYFSVKGVKYISILKWTNEHCVNVTDQFYMANLSPKWNNSLEKGLYEIHYRIDDQYYRHMNVCSPKDLRNIISEKTDASLENVEILSAFSEDQDISFIIREYAGPNNDFYGKKLLQLKHVTKRHNIKEVELLTSNFEEVVINKPDDLIRQ